MPGVLVRSSLLALLLLATLATSLTPEERGELARKFKYYHQSVRPGDKFNLIETLNGTFFNLNAEIELLQTRPIPFQNAMKIEMVMIIHYLDDRLIMRELDDVLTIPAEFNPWVPVIEISPNVHPTKSIHVDPKTGQMTVFYRIHSEISCFSEIWKHPFERFQCDLYFSTGQDERIFVRSMRDLRPDTQIGNIDYQTEEWPNMVFHLIFSSQWHSSIVNLYLPSILIFSVVIFAQWKRRKLQVLVTVAAMVSIIVMQTSQRKYDQITMQDLWMSGLLLHLIAILTVDLVLPARRIINTTYSSGTLPSAQTTYYPRVKRGSTERSPLIPYSPALASGRINTFAFVGPGSPDSGAHTPAPLAKCDSESDGFTDGYLIRPNPNNGYSSRTTPVHRQVTEVTIGKKKRLALAIILVFYAVFFLTYTALVFFVLVSS